MTTSDKPRRLAFELPKKAGNKTSSVMLELGPHKFKCKPTIDGLTLLEFAMLAGQMPQPDELDTPEEAEAKIDPAASVEAAGAILKLLQTCIIDYDAFSKIVKENDVDIELLGEIASGLVSQYTDRAPQSPSES